MRKWREIDLHGGFGTPGSDDPNDFVIFARRATYLGGIGQLPQAVRLHVNCEGLQVLRQQLYYWDDQSEVLRSIPWAGVEWIELTDGSRAKSRVAATVAFGVAGLGAKGHEEFAEAVVHLRDGQVAAFAMTDVRAAELRARIATTCSTAGVPLDRPPSPTEPSGAALVDELERLAALHASGVLTDEEFADFKSQLRRT